MTGVPFCCAALLIVDFLPPASSSTPTRPRPPHGLRAYTPAQPADPRPPPTALFSSHAALVRPQRSSCNAPGWPCGPSLRSHFLLPFDFSRAAFALSAATGAAPWESDPTHARDAVFAPAPEIGFTATTSPAPATAPTCIMVLKGM